VLYSNNGYPDALLQPNDGDDDIIVIVIIDRGIDTDAYARPSSDQRICTVTTRNTSSAAADWGLPELAITTGWN
jgi:hypothetical protein